MKRRAALKSIALAGATLAIGIQQTEAKASNKSVQDIYRPLLSDQNIDWDEQYRRCKDGYTAEDGNYINGYHYFYCNILMIKTMNIEDGKMAWQHPLYREIDKIRFDSIWPKQGNRSNHFELSARASGVTAVFFIGLSMYNFVMDTGIFPTVAIFSQKHISDYHKALFLETFERLPEIFKKGGWKYKEDPFMPSGFDRNRLVKTERNRGKMIELREMRFLGPNFSAKADRYQDIIITDPYSIISEKIERIVSDSVPSLSYGKDQWGSVIVAGSLSHKFFLGHLGVYSKDKKFIGNRVITTAQQSAILFFNPKTGKSDEKSALAWITESRKKITDKEVIAVVKRENPTCLEDFKL